MRRRLLNASVGISLLMCAAAVTACLRSYLVFESIRYLRAIPSYDSTHELSSGDGYLSYHYVGMQGGQRRFADPWRPNRLEWVRWPDHQRWRLRRGAELRYEYNADAARQNLPYERRVVVRFHYWVPVLASLILSVVAITVRSRSKRLAAAGRCTSCGYDLRVTPQRCPECGAVPESGRTAA
ncbi:MAG: hypothetical protein WBD40_21710 [Tepidisphaeraceae bacterium]